ncbi:HNH endonuclease [Arcanobacterium buesumense]|uniref:HNH endonuclease n=1 Tax=Arcanobacterium buesumense TaxID=2722751 RepID=A0A6H2ENQ3_9ACTO|nr:HNH endonuclease [Arcanobacterium buesumense]
MPTNRTGTAKHKRFRQNVLHRDQTNGLTHCPLCGTQLAWGTHGQPNSPEADHIIPARWGGADTTDNGQTICRHCNQSKGDGRKQQKFKKAQQPTNTTDINW